MYTRFDGVFFEKTRLSILSLLYREGAVSFRTLRDRMGGTDGAIYTHLERLLQAGYIGKKRRIVGRSAQTIYTLTRRGSTMFREYIGLLERVLQDHLGLGLGGNRNDAD